MGGPKKMLNKKRGAPSRDEIAKRVAREALREKRVTSKEKLAKLTVEKKTLQDRLDDLIVVNAEQLNRIVSQSLLELRIKELENQLSVELEKQLSTEKDS